MAKSAGSGPEIVLWNLVTQAIISAFTLSTAAVAEWYQGVLKADQHAGVHLGPLGSAIASVSPLIVILIFGIVGFLIAIGALLFVQSRMRLRAAAQEATPTTPAEPNNLKQTIADMYDKVYEANRARDEARAERDELKNVVQEITRQRDQIQSEWKAIHRELAEAPTKAAIQGVIYERDALRQRVQEFEAAALAQESNPAPLLAGNVQRFENLDAADLDKAEFAELTEEFGRPLTVHDGLKAIFGRPSGFRYIAWLQIETVSTPSKATNWTFSVQERDGTAVECRPVARTWKPPKSWPNLEYHSLDEAANMVLQSDKLYNVFLHVVCDSRLADLRMDSFQATCEDKNGTAVVLRMTNHG
jgi:hypothetical protein